MVICEEPHFIRLCEDEGNLIKVAVQHNPRLLGLLDLLQQRPVVRSAGGELSQGDLRVGEGFGKLQQFLQLHQTGLRLIENYEGLPPGFSHKISVGLAKNFRVRMDIDAELRPGLDVVEVVHDEGDVEGVGEGLDMVGGGGGDGPEDPGHPGVEEVTQGLAGLEAVITGVPGGEQDI